MLFDWLVTGQVVATNPAHAVRGPKHVVKTGKTPVLTGEQARELLDSIDVTTARRPARSRADRGDDLCLRAHRRGRRACASRIITPTASAGGCGCMRKAASVHEMPAHHNLEAYLDAYIAAAGIRDAGKAPLFRSAAAAPAC